MNNKKFFFVVTFLVFLLSMFGNTASAAPTAAPLFSVNVIAPTSNPVRMQYAQLMEQEFPKIGIAAELDLISWDALGPRSTDTIVGPYAEGGYDISFFGMSLSSLNPGPSMLVVYHEEGLPPNGFNVMYWTDDDPKYMNYRANESATAIEAINRELNRTKAKEMLADWQKIWYDVMPNVMIYNQYEVHALSKGFYGYDPVYYPFASVEDQWTTADFTGPNRDTIIAGVTTSGNEFNTYLATDVYDEYSAGPPQDGLVGLTPSNAVVLPETMDKAAWMFANYGTTDHLELYPRVATALGTWSPDQTNYSIELRDDVFFHDGEQVDAWDVAMTFQMQITPDVGTSVYSESKIVFGDDDQANNHGNYSFIPKDLNDDGFYETISFILPDIYAPFETSVVGQAILPEHILGDPDKHGYSDFVLADYEDDWNISEFTFDPVGKWLVKPADWDTHSYNTGQTADAGGLPGPIGCGSMVFYDFNVGTGLIELRKFEDIMWSGTAWVTNTTNDHYLIDDLGDMPDVAKLVVTSTDAGLAEMKQGKINVLDAQFSLGAILRELQADSTITPVLSTEAGWQAIYLNPQYKADTELGLNDRPFNRKGVRHAVSHIVPREEIVLWLLNGLGQPAFTPVPVTSWAIMEEDDMLAYKRTVVASDGSLIEAGATTAYDEYSLETAMKWMASEGYDMRPWGGPGPIETETTEPTKTAEPTEPTKTKTKTSDEGPGAPGFDFIVVLTIIGAIIILRKRRQ